jgi:hypothetical protein
MHSIISRTGTVPCLITKIPAQIPIVGYDQMPLLNIFTPSMHTNKSLNYLAKFNLIHI